MKLKNKKKSITNYTYYVSNYNWIWILETFSLQGVPKGEFIRTVKSPDGKYLIKTYFHNAGSLSADAVRGELVNLDTDSEKNIYWNYPDTDPYIEWVNKNIVRIGDQTLDVSQKETYDWRDDDKHVKEMPKQFIR